jgi:PAS domain S-box-containing protein
VAGKIVQPDRHKRASAWWIYCVSGVVGTVGYLLMPYPVVRDLVFYPALAGSAVVAIMIGARINRPAHPLAWYLFAASVLMFTIGDAMFNFYEHILGVDPFPSVADAFYLGSYLPLTVGLLILARGRTSGGDRTSFVDAAIIATGLGMLVWVFLMAPHVQDSSLTLFERSVLTAYPLADVLVLAVLARFMIAPGVRTPAYHFLGASLTTLLICDVSFGAAELAGTYESGGLIDAGFLLSYVLLGTASLHQTMDRLSQPAPDLKVKPSRRRFVLLAGASLLAPTVLAIQAARGEQVYGPLIVGGSVVLFSLVLVRMESLLGVLTTVVAERERAQERLRQAETRYRTLVEGMPAVVYTQEIESSTSAMYMSPQIQTLTGYSPEECKDPDLRWRMVHPDDRERMRAEDDQTGEPGEVFATEYRVLHRDGRTVWVRNESVLIEEEGSGSRYWQGFMVDIIQRKRAEEETQKAREAAEAASKAKSEFLANMSHEIRTPMNGVIGMTGLLLDTDLTRDQQEYAETVRSSGDALLTILNDILDFSKIEAGRMEIEILDFDLDTVVEESVGLLAERAHDKGLELASQIEQNVPIALKGDPGRIRQVLVNLLSNAVKFTEKGEVILRARLAEDRQDAAVVRFEIEDTGIGVAQELQKNLFESFSQADASTTRKYGGTGLGLTISKQLVELMGGEIGIESELGKGSTFFFTLSLEKQPEGTRQLYLVPRVDLRDLRVLVVDDNETNRKILHHQITTWGMKTGSAEDGPNAIKMLCEAANRSESYDVAILDMHMPDMDGLELAQKIKEEPSIATTKLIMMSSVGGRDVGAEARQVGIEVYLTKPVRQSRLYDAIATAMDTPTEGAPAPSVVDAPPIDTPLVATSALHKPKERPRILIAEDNAVNQKAAAKMLEMLGYRADVVANGLEAIEALSHITYAAVLMDVQMPEMDGYEATAEVRRREEKKDRRTPIIAMTANAMQGDRERALEAGMDDYVPKPVKREELEMIMQR